MYFSDMDLMNLQHKKTRKKNNKIYRLFKDELVETISKSFVSDVVRF